MRTTCLIDPLCGWSFGNLPGIRRLQRRLGDEATFDLLPVGLWAGDRSRWLNADDAAELGRESNRVSRATGAAFGPAYYTALLRNDLWLDSEPPSRAIVTVRELWPDRLFDFAEAVMDAWFQRGRDLGLAQTYDAICGRLGLEQRRFLAAYQSREFRERTAEVFESFRPQGGLLPALMIEADDVYRTVQVGPRSLDEVVRGIGSELFGHLPGGCITISQANRSTIYPLAAA